ncbi:hypothetical protein [Mycobacterium paragordonae]|uniref:hypothetical protein n=1 Tax=Mycobacterium paragordonae TaxID=1389713 RepID=UPI00105E428C|nr:hypothetical protein [Mycobacterium paragordonae]TDL05445.1 hypothetical protein EUA05_17880 [Mycobacterium paragordonae]
MAVAARQARKPRETAEQVRSVTAAGAEAAITARERAAAHAQQAIAGLWVSVNPYNRDDVAAFAGQAARIMGTAQSAAARAAAVTQARQLTAMGVKASSAQQVPLDVRARGAKLVRGRLVLQRPDAKVDYAGADRVSVDAESMTTSRVFERPAAVYRRLISQGEGDAAEQSMLRIRTLVDDNLMLAQRLAQQEVLARAAVDLDNQGGRGRRRPQIIGYRRVIHPELSRGGTCGMCIAASDRIYKIGTLMPIHAHCWCTIAAITEEHDPADDLNAVDLRALYKDAGGNTVAHLKRTRYQVDEHGELGPVLVPKKKYKPRTAQSAKRAGKNAGADPSAKPESKAGVAARHLPLLEKNLADLRARGLAEDSPQITYHLQQIAKFKKELAH